HLAVQVADAAIVGFQQYRSYRDARREESAGKRERVRNNEHQSTLQKRNRAWQSTNHDDFLISRLAIKIQGESLTSFQSKLSELQRLRRAYESCSDEQQGGKARLLKSIKRRSKE